MFTGELVESVFDGKAYAITGTVLCSGNRLPRFGSADVTLARALFEAETGERPSRARRSSGIAGDPKTRYREGRNPHGSAPYAREIGQIYGLVRCCIEYIIQSWF
jgi:hypothetical protein